jgi:phosphoglycerate dehydrogenase-like enzyme
LLGHTELALLPHEAVVVNVGRGDIIDEDALYTALAEKKVGPCRPEAA